VYSSFREGASLPALDLVTSEISMKEWVALMRGATAMATVGLQGCWQADTVKDRQRSWPLGSMQQEEALIC
jgi:hypothetical protein